VSEAVPTPPPRLASVVLIGGTGARLGGTDKAALELDGVSLLERAIRATAAAEEVVVVGDPVDTSRPVTWAREEPAGGGPAAGLLAGLDALLRPPDLVLVLAVDMPRVTQSTVSRLVAAVLAAPDADAAVLVDASRRRQTLAGVYRFGALMSARPVDRQQEHGLAIRRLVGGLRFVDVTGIADETRDVDTWSDLRALGQ
jgi:molybdopterin-guanine dinucleotide biosynthesis protein A